MFFKHIKHTKQFTTMTTRNNTPKNKKKKPRKFLLINFNAIFNRLNISKKITISEL